MSPRSLDQEHRGPEEQACAWCERLSEGALAPADQAAFSAWLAADEINRQAFDDAISAWRAVELAATTPELVRMRTAALTTFRKGQRARWTPRRALRAPWLPFAAAAALVIVLFGGGGVWLKLQPQIYSTAIGERRVVVLADGSKVSLDAASKVEVRYRGDRRELTLDYGRAKFTVAKNPSRPFTVAAADKVVIATGTEFSVEMLSGQVQVILYQGHVKVLDKPSPHAVAERVVLASALTPADQTLTPGRELVTGVSAPTAQVVSVDPVRTLSWEGGQLVFVDEPLSSAVERVNRYSDDKLVIGDPAVGGMLISGNFTAGDTPAFVQGVTGVFHVRLTEAGGRKVLVSDGSSHGAGK